MSQNKVKINGCLEIIEKGTRDTNLVVAYNELATELLGSADEKAKTYGYYALHLSKHLKHDYLTSWSYNIIGLSYDYLGKPDSALYNYQQAILLKQKLNDNDGLGAVNMNIGVMYYYQNDNSNAIKYYNKSIEYYKNVNNQNKIAGALNNIGVIYRQEKKYNEALKIFMQAYEVKEKTADTTGMANALGNLGVVYQYMGDLKKAESYHLQSMFLDSIKGNKYNIVSSYISLAELNFYLKNNSKTKSNLERAIKLAETINAIHYLDDAYKVYTQYDSAVGDYKAAYFHLKQYNTYNDQILKEDRLKQMDKLETVFSTKEKEQQIKLLNANSEIADLKIKRQNTQLIVFACISFLLILLLIGIIWVYKKTRRQRRELEEKNELINRALSEKDMLLKEIHHRVKNNLQIISSLLSIQSRYIKDEKALEAINESKDRVNAISLLHQEIYQNDVLKLINAKVYLENLIQRIKNTFNPENSIEIETDIDKEELDIDQLIPIGLIVNELLTNAYKYGSTNKDPKIFFKFKVNSGLVSLSIRDNGVGIDLEKLTGKKDSLGFKLVKTFTLKLKGELKIEESLGTLITITFKTKNA
jgi:two-component system, sensor histidine kinase PdtaS